MFDGKSFVITLLLHISACVTSECGLTTENSFCNLYWNKQYCTEAEQRWVSKNNDLFQTSFSYLWNSVFQVWNSYHQWKCSVTSRHRTVPGFFFSYDCMFNCMIFICYVACTLCLENSSYFSCILAEVLNQPFHKWNFQSAQVKISHV